MPLVSLRTLLDAAEAGNFAVGSFNCNNMEIVQAIIEAAEETRSPVIIQASQGAIKYAGLPYIQNLVNTAASLSTVPVCLHLDHGTDIGQVMRCLRSGFTSVMYDGSQHDIETNIANTKWIVGVAHAMGVSVEGEIGKIGGVEDDVRVDERDALLTPPADGIRFYRETGIDALAMAIGTAHGLYKLPPALAFDRMEAVRNATGAYLVMHGGSGVPDADVRRGISLGMRKINIDTELRDAFVTALRRQIEASPKEIDPRKLLGPAKNAMKERVKEKMQLFGSVGQADRIKG